MTIMRDLDPLEATARAAAPVQILLQFFVFMSVIGFVAVAVFGSTSGIEGKLQELADKGAPVTPRSVESPEFVSAMVLVSAINLIVGYLIALRMASRKYWASIVVLLFGFILLVEIGLRLGAVRRVMADPGYIVVAALSSLPLLLLAVNTIAGSWRIFRLERNERHLVAPLNFGLLSHRSLLQMMGRPAAASFSRGWRNAAANISFGISSFFFLTMFGAIAFLPGNSPAALRFAGQFCRDNAASFSVPVECPDSPLHWAVTFFAFVLFVISLHAFLGNVFRAAARRLVRTSLWELIDVDHRQPVLFLRPFSSDKDLLKPADIPLLARLVRLTPRNPLRIERSNLDTLMVEEGSFHGPVAGLSDDPAAVMRWGVAKGVVDQEPSPSWTSSPRLNRLDVGPEADRWKNIIRNLAADACAIVLVPAATDGMHWELDLVAERTLMEKTLFLFEPPGAEQRGEQRVSGRPALELVVSHLRRSAENAELDTHLAALLEAARTLEQREPKAVAIGLFRHNDGHWRMGVSSTQSDLAYVLMLRWYLRETLGQKPRTVVRSRRHAAA